MDDKSIAGLLINKFIPSVKSNKNKVILSLVTLVIIITLLFNHSIFINKKENYQFTCGVAPNRINDFSLDTVKGYKFVFIPASRWNKNNLKVYFIDTYDYDLIQRTLTVANIWSKNANIKFSWTTNIRDSAIRVSFKERRGYLSVIGNAAENEEYTDRATLWLQNLDTRSDDEFKRVVLHEFGHALGLEHELQSPNSDVQWDTAAVYTYFDTTYHWTKEMVNDNVFRIIRTGEYTRFDRNSIMIYAIPSFLTKNNERILWPENLSLLDKKNIGRYYK